MNTKKPALKSAFLALLQERRVFEGYTIDSDGTSLMDDGFSITETPTGYHVGFFIADTSLYYEETQTRPKPRRQSPTPNIGDASDVLKPRRFSLDEDNTSPAIGVFIDTDKDGHILDITIERVLFKNKKAFTTSEFKRSTQAENSDVLKWVSFAQKIKNISNRNALMQPSHGIDFCESISTFSNYALTLFCQQNGIPLVYQNRSAYYTVSDTNKLEFNDREGLLKTVGSLTPQGEIKLEQDFFCEIGMIEYSAFPKGNVTKGYSPYARFSSPIRFVLDTINLWNLTQYLEGREATAFDREDLEKIAQQQTRFYQNSITINEERKAEKIKKQIAKLVENNNEGSTDLNALPTHELSTLLRYIFLLDEKDLVVFAKTVRAYKRDDDFLSQVIDMLAKEHQFCTKIESDPKTAEKRIKSVLVKENLPPDVRHDENGKLKASFMEDVRTQLNNSLLEICSKMIVFPFIKEAYDRIQKENNIHFLVICSLGNPERNDREKLLAQAATQKLLLLSTQNSDRILRDILSHKFGIDEIYFTAHGHHNRHAVIQPFIRMGSTILTTPSLSYQDKSPEELLILAKRNLIEALLKNNLVRAGEERIEWSGNQRKNKKKNFRRHNRR